MKVALVLGCNIHWTPYYYLYERMLASKSIPFDLIIWNRELLKEESLGNVIPFNLPDVSSSKDPKKFYKFLLFARFVKETVKKNKYDKIVFLGLQGCALPLRALFYVTKYKYKYWIDIRDYHYEWFKPYYLLEKVAIHYAKEAAISSEGFKTFLPKERYIHVHNVDPDIVELRRKYKKNKSERIRICFIGNVRYLEENKKLLEIFKNDDRFELQYNGNGSEVIREYCSKNNIYNVAFSPSFPREETIKYYNNTDIINNIYGNTSLETTTALSNKLYYSIYLGIPIIVSSGTYMEQFCKKYGFGIAFKEDPSFKEELYEWYKSICLNTSVYDPARELITSENSEFSKRFLAFLGESL